MLRTIWIIIFLCIARNLMAQTWSMDSVLERIESEKFSNPENALIIGYNALEVAKSGDKSAKLHNAIGKVLVALSQFDSARVHHEMALEISNELKNQIERAESLNNLGIVNDERGRHTVALEHYFLSLEIFESEGDLRGQAKVLNNIGIVYKDLGDLRSVVKYYRDAMTIYDSLDYQLGKFSLYNNLATVHNNLEEYQNALDYALPTIEYFIENDYQQYIPYPSINAGDALIGLNRYDEAIIHLDKAYEGLVSYGNTKELADVNRSLSAAYQAKGMRIEAIQSAKRSLTSALEVGSLLYEQNAYQRLSEVHAAFGLYDSAFFYFRDYVSVRDSILNEERLEQVNELRIRYETAEKEKRLAMQQIEINRKDSLLIASMSVSSLIILSLIFLFTFRKNREKLIHERAINREREQHLKALFSAQEEERQRIAQNLHDSVGQAMSALIMSMEHPEDSKDEKPVQMSEKSKVIRDIYQEIREISHELMPGSLKEVGLAPAIEQLLRTTLDGSKISWEFDGGLNVDVRYEEEIEACLFRIFQELLQNACKHSNAGLISVGVYERKGELHLLFEDDGDGFDESTVKPGIGLIGIKSRVRAFKGDLQVNSQEHPGTIVHVRLPLNKKTE